jgi:hypothetical protein
VVRAKDGADGRGAEGFSKGVAPYCVQEAIA